MRQHRLAREHAPAQRPPRGRRDTVRAFAATRSNPPHQTGTFPPRCAANQRLSVCGLAPAAIPHAGDRMHHRNLPTAGTSTRHRDLQPFHRLHLPESQGHARNTGTAAVEDHCCAASRAHGRRHHDAAPAPLVSLVGHRRVPSPGAERSRAASAAREPPRRAGGDRGRAGRAGGGLHGARRLARRPFGPERARARIRALPTRSAPPGSAAETHGALLLTAGLASCASCSPRPRPLDLVRAESVLAEADVTGNGMEWTRGQMGRHVRLNDVVRRTLPASPPSRLRFVMDVPAGSRLELSCAIAPESQDQPGVEFVVTARRDGREQVRWSQLLDPLNKPEQAVVDASLDLRARGGATWSWCWRRAGNEAGRARAPMGLARVSADAAAPAPLVVVYLGDTAARGSPHTLRLRAHKPPRAASGSRRTPSCSSRRSRHASWTSPRWPPSSPPSSPRRHRAVQLRDTLDPAWSRWPR